MMKPHIYVEIDVAFDDENKDKGIAALRMLDYYLCSPEAWEIVQVDPHPEESVIHFTLGMEIPDNFETEYEYNNN